MPAQPGWTEHANELVPIIQWVGGVLVATIVVMGGALIKAMLYIGKLFTMEIKGLKADVAVIHDSMLGCDGCREALEKFGRRSTDH